MAQELFAIEKGLSLEGENSDSGIKLLFGSAAPGGDAAEQDAAEQGSVYCRTNGEFFQKVTAGTGTDKWERMAKLSDVTSVTFRGEKVQVATGDAAPVFPAVINFDTNPFGDDDAPDLGNSDLAIGDFVLFGVGGTPVLAEVTASGASDRTLNAAEFPLVDNDFLIVRNYLPDSPDAQEKSAIVFYNGSGIEKIGDLNWNFADGINLEASYAAASGDVTNADTVQESIQKVDGNNDAQDTTLGTAQGATDLGTFSGDTLQDNVAVKVALQTLETELEDKSSQNGVTTEVTLDELLVDDFLAAQWLIVARLDSAPARVKTFIIEGAHDGHAGADAGNADYTSYAKLKIGSGFNVNLSVDLNGSGTGQTMRLRVGASAAISVRAQLMSKVRAQGL